MINYRTIPHEFKPYTSRFPSEAFGQAILMRQGQYEQGVQKTQQQIDYLANLPSLPGPDTELKNQKINQLTSALSELASQDLSDPAIQTQINSYVSRVSNDDDMLNIVSRAVQFKGLKDKYERMTENGETVSPWDMTGLQEAYDYMNSGSYIKNKRFAGDIYKSPDFQGFLFGKAKEVEADLMANKGLDKNWFEQEDELKTRSAEKIKESVTGAFTNQPQMKLAFDRMMDYETKGNNVLKYYQDQATEGLAALYDVQNTAQSMIDAETLMRTRTGKTTISDEELKVYQAMLDKAEEQKAIYEAYLDPAFDDYAAKQLYKKGRLDEMVNGAVKAYTLTEHKTKTNISEFNKMDKAFGQDLKKMAQAHLYKLAEIEKSGEFKGASRVKADVQMKKDIDDIVTGTTHNIGKPTADGKQQVALPVSLAKQKFAVMVNRGKSGYQTKQAVDPVTGLPKYDSKGNAVLVKLPFESESEAVANLTPTKAFKKDGVLWLEFNYGKDVYTRPIQEVVEDPDEKPATDATTTTTPDATGATGASGTTGAKTPPNSMK